MYGDGSSEILKGCKCGGKLFFYIKKSALERQEEHIQLSQKDKEQIEKDVYDILGTQIDKEKPIVLDIESIKILRPGQYELDIVNLFKKQPLIYKLEEGKYVIDLIQSFKKNK
ncbi:MAG: Zn-ribbon domain-containing protein [Nanoarchaeota archaeon]|nr:Zn-ribbon domain-containing protein [Nanoarchaeota archaeon]MBU1029671.1 Zn-ribbon domain-containing protein [Nanoarchaeota archaeon]MBU1849387.1 Zn-ribbon domain-containing protein [Nanoarchaeota archaeon]